VNSLLLLVVLLTSSSSTRKRRRRLLLLASHRPLTDLLCQQSEKLEQWVGLVGARWFPTCKKC
jgi:hypothetical protein